LLCRTYQALKAVDPNLVILSGPLSPTLSLTQRDLNEFIFLERMYAAGAGDCFDVMSAQGYGFNSGPTDRRMRFNHATFARPLYIREIMVQNGDAEKSIWISEAAWNPQPYDPVIIQNGAFGIVSQEQAARYMPLAYERAMQEWPWIGNISYWFFKHADDSRRNQAMYYFRMVEPDFTPLPVYNSMRNYITTLEPTLYAGVHQAEDWAISTANDTQLVPAAGAQFGQTMQTSSLRFTFYGTGYSLRYRESATEPWQHIRSEPSPFQAQRMPTAYPELPVGAQVDSITVFDHSGRNLYPVAGLVIGAVFMIGLMLAESWRRRA
jgi:polysaccharide biosynthesis protein PslG